jgi:OmpA-OmpF porin, OOP family
VNSSCTQCGTELMDFAVFCTRCGTRRTGAGQSPGAPRFCNKCGTLLGGEAKFCRNCGAPGGTAEAVTPNPPGTAAAAPGTLPATTSNSQHATQPVATAPISVAAAGAPPAKPSRGLLKTALAMIAIFAVLVVAAVAGVAYVVHEIRQKATQAEKSLAHAAAARARQNPINPGTNQASGPMARDSGGSPAGIPAAAAPPTTNPEKPLTQEERNKSLTDAAAVASAIEQNANKQPGEIPPSALPPGTSAISVPSSGGYLWENGGVHYTWNNKGLRIDYAGGTSTYAECAIVNPAPQGGGPIAPVAATGNQAQDWMLKYERTEGGPEADLLVRTGDINNLGFGWPQGFDPFSGQSTPSHSFPWKPQADEPQGTDRIMVGSAVGQEDIAFDGYSRSSHCSCPAKWPPCQDRLDTMPQAVTLSLGTLPSKIDAVLFQFFVDDFQPHAIQSHFQVSLNGTRIGNFEYAINSLDQTGPVGKLLTLRLLPEYWPLLKSGTVKVLFDDPTTHRADGYAVDFVRILVNPNQLKYQVSLTATVTDADKHTPIAGATVSAALASAATDRLGKCELKGIPAGLVIATATAPGYDENSVNVDLPAGKTGHADIPLHRHQESTAALEQSIAKTGTATIYGIHFDTDSSKLRPDSLPALNAVLGLINNHPASRWLIAGHTDSQGTEAHNLPLSQSRAESVVTWLKQHGADVSRLVPQGFGDERPVADNATANGRALNRRVEVALTK